MFGPLFDYEFRAAARRGRTFVLRVLVALALLAVLYLTYATHFPNVELFDAPQVERSRMAHVGHEFVMACAIALYFVTLLLTPLVMADAIAGERERGSLDLLLTTALTDAEIVWGKFAGRAIGLIAVLLTAGPVFALAQLFGGVAPDVAIAGGVVPALTVFGLGAICLLASASTQTALTATVFSYIWAVFWLTGSCCGFGGLLGIRVGGAGIALMIVAGGFNLIAALVCNSAAAGTLRRRPGRPVPLPPPVKVWETKPARPIEVPVSRRPLPPVGDAPLWWKERFAFAAFDEAGVGSALTSAAVIAAIIGTGMQAEFRGMLPRFEMLVRDFCRVFVALTGTLVILLAIYRAANSVVRERECDTLISLLMLPVSRRELLTAMGCGILTAATPRIFAGAASLVVLAAMAGGCLHPFGVPVLALSLASSLVLATGLGVMLSVWCRTALRANLTMVLAGCFLLSGPYIILNYLAFADPTGFAAVRWAWMPVLSAALTPPVTWWQALLTHDDWAKMSREMLLAMVIGPVLVMSAGAWCWLLADWGFRRDDGRRA